MIYVLHYEKTPDFAARQGEFAASHRDHVMSAATGGALRLAGSLSDPDNGDAMLVFETEGPEPVEQFAKADPYVTNGIIRRWSVRRWDLVVGGNRMAG